MADIDLSARELAVKLDAGNENDVNDGLTKFRDELTRDDFKRLVTTTASLEQDGQGLDMVIKYDRQNNPEHYVVLSSELRGSAQNMTNFMDNGNGRDAQQYRDAVAAEIVRAYPDPAVAQTEYAKWATAVDALEKDGIGSDVTINNQSGHFNAYFDYRMPKR